MRGLAGRAPIHWSRRWHQISQHLEAWRLFREQLYCSNFSVSWLALNSVCSHNKLDPGTSLPLKKTRLFGFPDQRPVTSVTAKIGPWTERARAPALSWDFSSVRARRATFYVQILVWFGIIFGYSSQVYQKFRWLKRERHQFTFFLCQWNLLLAAVISLAEERRRPLGTVTVVMQTWTPPNNHLYPFVMYGFFPTHFTTMGRQP